MAFLAHRYHDISCGHRVFGHEGKCALLHGHNYRIHFTVESASVDNVGRVVDFSVIKRELCEWLEESWDHRFLMWSEDPDLPRLREAALGVIEVPFNPTAENMAHYLLHTIGPYQLSRYSGLRLVSVIVEETRKCSAEACIE